MRAFAYVVITVLLLLLAGNEPAEADLLVASFDTGQVLRYDDTTGAFLDVFATGLPDDHPVCMTVGPDGNLYVGMNNFGGSQMAFVRRFDGQTGLLIDTFTSGTDLSDAADVVFGPDGNLYVAEFGPFAESRVIRYDGITGAFIDDFVPVGSGGLTGAQGIVFGPDDNLYVTSRITGQVLRYDGSTGAFQGVFATGPVNGPVALTFRPDGNLYVLYTFSATGEVLRFDGSTGAFIDVFATEFCCPSDGANFDFRSDGNLYASAGFAHTVLRFDGSSGQLIDTFVTSGSGGLRYATNMMFIAPAPEIVSIDIKPGSSRNPMNPRANGRIPVAILSSPSFDAATADSTTVRFGATGIEARALHSALEDVDGDGDPDMILQFKNRDTGIQCGATSAVLTGETLGGQRIAGADPVTTVGCH
jgi:DNA-binding beta-propeller fold protein YncE